MMTFPFTTTRLFLDYDLAPYPNIVACLKRIESRVRPEFIMMLALTNTLMARAVNRSRSGSPCGGGCTACDSVRACSSAS